MQERTETIVVLHPRVALSSSEPSSEQFGYLCTRKMASMSVGAHKGVFFMQELFYNRPLNPLPHILVVIQSGYLHA